MIGFASLDPEQQAARLRDAGSVALRRWGISDARLELIKYRENAVFRVEHGGGRYVLRVHRSGYHSDAELRSELQWIQALAGAGIEVPTAVLTPSGESFITHEEPGLPGPVQMDLFEWISGEQLGSVEHGVAPGAAIAPLYRTIGELAGRIHNQSSVWNAPAGFIRHAWDAEGLAGERPYWGPFWELESAAPGQRDLLARGRARAFRDLSCLNKSPTTYSMIHADLLPENLLVDGGRVRLIDFDDAGFGWHLFELATVLYMIADEAYFTEAREALFAGYRRHRRLPDEELEKLPLFMLARGLSYVSWVHTRRQTDTAREMTPALLDAACRLADEYLSN